MNYSRTEKAAITRALNIIREHTRLDYERDPVGSSSAAKTMVTLHLGELDPDREHLAVFLLDSQHSLIGMRCLFHGTLDGAAVYPREVARAALDGGAARIIMAHNHPSGIAEPSAADRRITERVSSALALLDIRLLDHVIVGRGQPASSAFSFAEEGLL